MGELENVAKHSQSTAKPWVRTEDGPASDEEPSTSRREFFSRIPGVAAVRLASAVPVISHAEAVESKGPSGAGNNEPLIPSNSVSMPYKRKPSFPHRGKSQMATSRNIRT
jgi:hypothetical protein